MRRHRRGNSTLHWIKTFIIDAEGKLAKIMRNVKPSEHADDVLAALS